MSTDNSFIILGSSSGMPQAGRATSGYLLKTDKELSLIDCGGGICSSFLEKGLNPLAIERIFITHTHSDHVCELSLFVQMIYLAGRKEKLDIYLPSEFIEPFKMYMNAVYLFKEKLPFEVNLIGYENGFVYDSYFKLTVFANNHLKGNAEIIDRLGLPNKMQCFSCLIEVAGKKIFYSSDISEFADVKDHLEGCDYILIEPTHIDIEELMEYVQEVNIGRYIITHLGDAEELTMLATLIQKYGIDNMVTAHDGMELEL